ncbi:MAG TPA: NUDIX domain-containing protein [Candidatus Hydrothermia bacterium]|nr:NUDIX domain-containing protein [Candidatus Hydrothermae bacterium]MDD3648554.1 NUDIX domain-containing protein [Candidatus Hydrothermia bacterium]MDD5572705.1 NUDIX domain-containing protein [Candidatus Hydrothermia bacterium]HOK22586.1 NUDIX domain-containing protein [Candidatus Hydrothermia bacterium]HOL23293.1 NUDIX domain-containing protein [Candidatus Hydrothermia bacterium]
MELKTKKEISSGFVVYTVENERILYLLLKHPTHWSFPKGHVEHNDNNDLIVTAKREMLEETGIQNFEIVEGFCKVLSYSFTKDHARVVKDVYYFLARCPQKEKIILSREHQDFGWFPLRLAYIRLNFENARELLVEANEFIKKIHGI